MTYPPLSGGRLWLWGKISPLLGRAEQAMGLPCLGESLSRGASHPYQGGRCNGGDWCAIGAHIGAGLKPSPAKGACFKGGFSGACPPIRRSPAKLIRHTLPRVSRLSPGSRGGPAYLWPRGQEGSTFKRSPRRTARAPAWIQRRSYPGLAPEESRPIGVALGGTYGAGPVGS